MRLRKRDHQLSRAAEAYPQLQASGLMHWDSLSGLLYLSLRPVASDTGNPRFAVMPVKPMQETDAERSVGAVPADMPDLIYKANNYKVYSCNRIPERDLFLLV